MRNDADRLMYSYCAHCTQPISMYRQDQMWIHTGTGSRLCAGVWSVQPRNAVPGNSTVTCNLCHERVFQSGAAWCGYSHSSSEVPSTCMNLAEHGHSPQETSIFLHSKCVHCRQKIHMKVTESFWRHTFTHQKICGLSVDTRAEPLLYEVTCGSCHGNVSRTDKKAYHWFHRTWTGCTHLGPKPADPELERLLAEEEEIIMRGREHKLSQNQTNEGNIDMNKQFWNVAAVSKPADPAVEDSVVLYGPETIFVGTEVAARAHVIRELPEEWAADDRIDQVEVLVTTLFPGRY